MKKAVKYVLLFLTLACLVNIFANSLRSAASSSQQSGRIVAFVSMIYYAITRRAVDPHLLSQVIRKLAHVSEFALLGFLGAGTIAAFFGKIRDKVYLILFWGLVSGVTDEFLQTFSKGRSPEVRDCIFDFSGFAAGFLIAWLICVCVARRQRRKHELDVSGD